MKILIISCLFALSNVTYSQDLVSNLKVCMPFNGNANDVSGSGNNGTVSGATLTNDRFGNASSAYQFNGVSDYISIASFANLAPTNELTISMWAKNDLTSEQCLFMLMPDHFNDRCTGCAQYRVSNWNTMMSWNYGNTASIYIVNANIASWQHYTYVISQVGNIKQMYINGTIVSNTTYSTTCTNKPSIIYWCRN